MPCRECLYYETEPLSTFGFCTHHNTEVSEQAHCKRFSKKRDQSISGGEE